ncbi:MAG: hypothetical protein WEB53_10190 [Akkermansiaceae bacterium]
MNDCQVSYLVVGGYAYIQSITQGQYALYQVRHQGEFAVAGLR